MACEQARTTCRLAVDEDGDGWETNYFICGEERRVRMHVQQCCRDWLGYVDVPEPHARMELFRPVADNLHKDGREVCMHILIRVSWDPMIWIIFPCLHCSACSMDLQQPRSKICLKARPTLSTQPSILQS